MPLLFDVDRLSSQNRDSVVGNLGDQVNDPENEAQTNEAQDTDYQGHNILGLHKELPRV